MFSPCLINGKDDYQWLCTRVAAGAGNAYADVNAYAVALGWTSRVPGTQCRNFLESRASFFQRGWRLGGHHVQCVCCICQFGLRHVAGCLVQAWFLRSVCKHNAAVLPLPSAPVGRGDGADGADAICMA